MFFTLLRIPEEIVYKRDLLYIFKTKPESFQFHSHFFSCITIIFVLFFLCANFVLNPKSLASNS